DRPAPGGGAAGRRAARKAEAQPGRSALAAAQRIGVLHPAGLGDDAPAQVADQLGVDATLAGERRAAPHDLRLAGRVEYRKPQVLLDLADLGREPEPAREEVDQFSVQRGDGP